VDDHQIITDSLSLLFERIKNTEVVQTYNDRCVVVESLKDLSPDIIITDFHMPHIDGIKLKGMIKSTYPEIDVIVLSVNEDPSDIKQAYHAGASGYLLKKVNKEELEKAVREVYEGNHYYNQETLKAILQEHTKKNEQLYVEPSKALARLTNRETEIVRLLVQEYSSQDIASALHINSGTAETYQHILLRKLDVKSTIGVVKLVIRAGLV